MGRIFYVYGPNQRKNSLLSYGKSQLKNKKTISLKNPLHFNDFIHVDDVSKKIIKLLEKNTFGTYNICSGRPQFNIDFLERQLSTKINFDNKSYNVSGFFGCTQKINKIM